ncbi:hypothetical protein [Dyadobacter sp. 676]|uniref:Uncharacterized protein n=1 Tax=Dyadobacter sp. 676 TaxID=3088362 RepID=A0AAU8FK68_9BACT
MKTPNTEPAVASVVQIRKFHNAEGRIHAVLSYNSSRNYLLMKWIGYSTDAEIVTALEEMKQWHQTTGKARGCRFHVHDTKEIEGSWAGTMEYICNDFFPECRRAGLSCNISIVSPRLFL